MDISAAISRVPLFEGLEPDNRRYVVEIAAAKTFRRGQQIFYDGEQAHGFYVVVSGRIKVYKLASDGKEQILHMLGPGEPFGEVPVFTNRHYPANAEAVESSTTLYFPKQDFIAAISQHPALGLNMMAVLSARLHAFTTLIENLSLREVPARLASYLLYLSALEDDVDQVELDITKVQLAGVLGTIPETLSRILGRMTREGLIAARGRRGLAILDRPALDRIARGEDRLS